MPNSRASDLTAVTPVQADLLYGVDVSDTTDNAGGSSRKFTLSDALTAGLVGYTKSGYAAGTAYSLTNTQALLHLGTTDPSISLDKVGRWLIEGRVNVQNNGATFAANRLVTCKLRDTTNSADVTNGSDTLATGIITTTSNQAGHCQMAGEITVSGATTIQLFGAVSVVPTAGSIDIVAPGTWIRATYLGLT